jgi:hypothetical protein
VQIARLCIPSHEDGNGYVPGVDSYGGLLTYIGGWLDRAGGRRADAKWLDEPLNRPDATLIPFWRDQCQH